MAKARRMRRREFTGGKTAFINVRLHPELLAVLERVADAEDIAVGALVRRMIYSYVVPLAKLKTIEDLLESGAPEDALQGFAELVGYDPADLARLRSLLSSLGGSYEKAS